MLISFPFVYAFGSNVNYWSVSSAAIIFWMLAGVLVAVQCLKISSYNLLCMAVIAELAIAQFLWVGIKNRYGSDQPLWLNVTPVNFGINGGSLFLSENYANFINQIRKEAYDHGFKPGTQMIDLSGLSPGILYSLRAKSLGSVWMIGGRPGTIKFALAALALETCNELSQAWILIEPGGPLQISPDNPNLILNSFGATLEGEYELVASWNTPVGMSGDGVHRLQQLFRPKSGGLKLYEACLRSRDFL